MVLGTPGLESDALEGKLQVHYGYVCAFSWIQQNSKNPENLLEYPAITKLKRLSAEFPSEPLFTHVSGLWVWVFAEALGFSPEHTQSSTHGSWG